MAFNHYSDLFKSGLLSESSSPIIQAHPYSSPLDALRKASLPTITQDVPLSPTRTSARDVEHAIASGDSLYFTFKKRRDPSELRSFLSLDLAESQSLRSASLKDKPSKELLQSTHRRTASSSRRSMSTFPSIMAIQSPPATSPVRGSFRSLSTGSTPFLSMSPPSPFNASHFIHAPVPRRPLQLALPQLSSQRELSPMLFASPPPSPVMTATSDHRSAPRPDGVLSRTSSVSTGYRVAQRGDALAQLEGRGGYRGRRAAPVAQNFMSMTDDEDEEDADAQLDRNGFEVIVEDVMEEESAWQSSSGPSQILHHHRSSSIERGLMASINGGPWYDLAPQKDPFTMFYDDDHESIEPMRLSPLEHALHHHSSSHSSIHSTSRRSKRSKFSRSPSREVFREKNSDSTHSSPHSSRKSLLPFRPTPSSSRSHTNLISDLGSTPSTRPHSSIMPPSATTKSKSPVPPSTRASSTSSSRRNSSEHHSNASRRQHNRHAHHSSIHAPLQRLTLNLEWLSSKADMVNFIDMRDDAPESDSRSDSWRSIFEVSCNA